MLTRSGEQVIVMMEISEEKIFPPLNHSDLVHLGLKNCSGLCRNICANMIRNHDSNIYHVYRDLNIQVSLRVNTLNMIRTRTLKSM